MGSTPMPLPGMGNDVTGNQLNPQDLLRRIYMQQQPAPPTQGSTAIGPAIPTPQGGNRHMMPIQPGAGAAQGEFTTKGAHQRASMQGLATTLQNTVAQANNALVQHEQKILSQKTDAYTHAMQGIAQAQEMLKADPTNLEAVQMKQHNEDFLKGFLDPTTPEGKKNIKLLTKAYAPVEEEKTPEQIAAQGSAKKVRQQADLAAHAEQLKSGSGFPQTAGMSPMTQINAQMVKAGVTPKAATGTAVLNNQEKAAQALQVADQKAAELALKTERLGLDPATGQPLPIEKLPLEKQAKIRSERAGDELKAAQAQYAQARAAAQADPKSPQNQLALMRAGAMQKFASASMLRAQVQLLNYHMNATSTGEGGETIPGAMMVNGQPIGKAYASQVDTTLQKQAQFIDVDGSIDNIAASAKALNDSGQKLNDPKLVKLLGNPHFKSGDNVWFQNEMNSGIGGTLTSQQRDYVIAQRQAVENMSALRGMLKSGVSQKQMDNIVNTVPGAQTPDFDYAMKQIQAVKGQLDRLRQGIPNVNIPSRPNQPGPGGTPSAPPDKLTNDLNKALSF